MNFEERCLINVAEWQNRREKLRKNHNLSPQNKWQTIGLKLGTASGNFGCNCKSDNLKLKSGWLLWILLIFRKNILIFKKLLIFRTNILTFINFFYVNFKLVPHSDFKVYVKVLELRFRACLFNKKCIVMLKC